MQCGLSDTYTGQFRRKQRLEPSPIGGMFRANHRWAVSHECMSSVKQTKPTKTKEHFNQRRKSCHDRQWK